MEPAILVLILFLGNIYAEFTTIYLSVLIFYRLGSETKKLFAKHLMGY